jgi:hypothetical protein
MSEESNSNIRMGRLLFPNQLRSLLSFASANAEYAENRIEGPLYIVCFPFDAPFASFLVCVTQVKKGNQYNKKLITSF